MHRAAVVMVFAAVAVAAPVPKAVKPKATNFDGTWELVEQSNDNRPVATISPWRWTIDGDALTRASGTGDGSFRPYTQPALFVRPADAQSNEMDYVPDAGRRESVCPGRAVIENDEFVVCWTSAGKPRPAELKPGPGVNYYRFKRVKDK